MSNKIVRDKRSQEYTVIQLAYTYILRLLIISIMHEHIVIRDTLGFTWDTFWDKTLFLDL